MSTEIQTRTLETDGATIAYDVAGPLPTADGRPPLLMIGQPMDASGFRALASEMADRTVVTYDPRGLGRSTRSDGRVDQRPEVQADDVHRLIAALGAGPVDLFASSGGAVTALALVTAHPEDIATLVAHEPPLAKVLPDAKAAHRALARFQDAYVQKGWGAGMAAFIFTTSWQGEFTEEFLAMPLPGPAQFGMPSEDDGRRDDPLLSNRALAITEYQPDIDALKKVPSRVVIGVAEETAGTFTDRTSRALAVQLGTDPVVFPSHHGGFVGGDTPYAGKPAEFAVRLRDVLAEGAVV